MFRPRPYAVIGLSALAWTLCLPATGIAADKAAAVSVTASAQKPASLADLVAQVNIPYEMFTLKNGLRVIVHTDRKAPVIGVTVYYRVGSKNEPKGKTGFAHLFEHLMFGGSENVPDFDYPLVEAGSTPTNGSTWYDRTNYVETVPTGAVDRALFMEADRMGHLLGAVTQAKLDAQRGVVQNEKRQGDNQPYGLVGYAQTAALFPPDHPYGHTTIGSMADLDAASVEDVKGWFRSNYGPNNAILVLAGDIDTGTARSKVERYFGDIPAGPAVAPVNAPVPTLPKRVDAVMKDRVATTRLYRTWVTPGRNDPAATQLAIGAAVLGGLSSSRLDNALVRKEQLAVSVTAGIEQQEQIGKFEVTVDVKPGVDPAKVSARLDELIAELVAKGPTADEVQRVATRSLSGEIAGLEVVGGFGGKATTLAEGLLYSDNPAEYKKDLAELAAATPQSVTKALQQWLKRPVYALTVEPGERSAYEESKLAGATPEAKPDGTKAPAPDAAAPAKPRLALPGVEATRPLDFPAVVTRKLSNGIAVHIARRTVIPTVQMTVSFDTGIAAEPREKSGIGSLLLSLLEAGTRTRDSIALAEEEERLGADVSTGQSMDRTTVSLYALTANLGASLDLLADIIRNPALDPAEVERLRAIQLSAIDSERTQPSGPALKAIFPLLYGDQHPYGMSSRGLGDTATVKAVTRQDLAAYHRRWIRPEKAEIFVAGNVDIDTLMSLLEQRFGLWPSTRDMPPQKDLTAAIPAPHASVYFIDRPQSPQSVIIGGFVTDKTTRDDLLDFVTANKILANDFTSRLNTDIREVKAWSYGVSGNLAQREGRSPYLISAPVQADKTGPAIEAMKQDMADFLGSKGVTKDEFNRIVSGDIARLPGRFETTGSVLGQMRDDAISGRPFDFVETLTARYKAMTPEKLDTTARAVLDPAKFSWVVVGDKSTVLPQLKTLGLPVTEIDSGGKPAK
ncbi:MAG TPA: pitrilysin family protein [Sphingobium sp.]|uniref:M16 family metallopeptidase n=1 Tax=Sphingobium sp. TaxID=1912891 RepID=UPI002ED11EE0